MTLIYLKELKNFACNPPAAAAHSAFNSVFQTVNPLNVPDRHVVNHPSKAFQFFTSSGTMEEGIFSVGLGKFWLCSSYLSWISCWHARKTRVSLQLVTYCLPLGVSLHWRAPEIPKYQSIVPHSSWQFPRAGAWSERVERFLCHRTNIGAPVTRSWPLSDKETKEFD